ncbi:MAG: UvrD-helicase domain-containing protein [Dehalococcoidia bacterium]|nr:UvrD-helicase domain-containing protein [Dehalococcoidia bacterium]
MKPTPEQAAILDAHDCDIAVSAGAGSGKTHVLVERYIALLQACRVPEIAAVTFTDPAAAEMRDRVRRAVMERTALHDHRADLDEAVIGTIHSLCLRLLREHPVESAIDPSAVVLPEDEAELLRHTASRAAVDEAAEAGDERTQAMGALSAFHTERLLPMLVANRDDVRRAFEAMGDPAGWEAYVRRRLDQVFGGQAEPLRARAEAAMVQVRAQRSLVGGRLSVVVEDVLACYDAPGEWLACARTAASAVNRQSGSRAPGSPDMLAKDAMKVFKDTVEEIARIPAWNEHDAPALEALVGVRAIFLDACDRYEAAKRERHALDFLDLETRAVALLRDHPEVARETRQRFRHLMVDEAQDVSPVQADLFMRMLGLNEPEAAAGAADEPPRPWLFLVGDAKQSIYRFRGADVAQFNALRTEVSGRGGRLLPLTRSFRTHDGLVDRFNELFERVFTADPDQAATMEPLAGRGSEPDGEYFTVMPIARKDADGGRTSDYRRRELEAALVAREIAHLLDHGAPVWNKRTQAYEPAQPRHVAILLRRFTHVHIFEQALEDVGVPYATPSGTGFFTRQEVRDLTNLLRWLAEPEDAIALAGVLRSPMFVIADDTLLALARGHSLWRTLRRLPEDLAAALDPADRARCEHAAAVLAELRDLAGRATPDAVLDHALQATGVEAAWAALDGGEQAVANLRKFARIVRGLAGYTVDEVVTYLEQRRDELAAREGPAVLDRPEAVQLMTVHGAKGLEFPVVFVPETHVDTFPSWDAVRWRSADGISLTLAPGDGEGSRLRPAFYSLLLDLDRRADDAEHLRLLYVAATRAADRLYLSGDEGDRGWFADVRDALAEGDLTHVEMRDPAVVGAADLRHTRAGRWTPPAPEQEQDYLSPLVDRPAVIPLRSSTPVTALKPPEQGYALGAAAAGDGLGTLRGNVAHRAIEATFRDGARPDLLALAREEAERALDAATLQAVAVEVGAILDRFEASDLAAALRQPEATPLFEVPFAWDWDGIPVHGSIDLLYRDTAGAWVVVDFKTDRLGAGGAAEVAQRYIVQVGLYGRALQAATGVQPRVGMLFLRSMELVEPDWEQVQRALDEARQRVDRGPMLDPEVSSEGLHSPGHALHEPLEA